MAGLSGIAAQRRLVRRFCQTDSAKISCATKSSLVRVPPAARPVHHRFKRQDTRPEVQLEPQQMRFGTGVAIGVKMVALEFDDPLGDDRLDLDIELAGQAQCVDPGFDVGQILLEYGVLQPIWKASRRLSQRWIGGRSSFRPPPSSSSSFSPDLRSNSAKPMLVSLLP